MKRGKKTGYKWIKAFFRRRLVLSVALAACIPGGCSGGQEQVLTPENLAEPIVREESAVSHELWEQTDAASKQADEMTGLSGGTDGEGGADGAGGQAGTDGLQAFTISAAGDCSLGNHADQDYGWSFRQMYDTQADPAYFFENVYPVLSEDDMTVINLEGVLTTSEERAEGQTYSIKGDPSYVDILTAGSVEAVSMANNHRLDYGEGGTADTVEALKGADISYAYDHNVGIYEKDGIKAGFVSVNEVNWGAGCEKLIQSGIERLREQQVNLILVCCHWGAERMESPEDYQRVLGKKCIDWGADLVIGHHPHVLQGIELYKGKYIIYSLANFCFGANRNPADKDTMIFRQTFYFKDGLLQDENEADIIPCKVSSVSERNDYKPTPAEGAEKVRILQRMAQASRGMGITIDSEGRLIPGE